MKEEELIKKRLFSVLQVSSLHMIEFLKLLNIRFTETETNTAAVTCSSRPELLLNKNFVDTYCKKDEHLFMLIMHELYHVILGHTHLFKTHSEIDNIAFDAVINAILCKMFPGEEYTSFFTSINEDKSFPGCILRPLGENTPTEFIPILKKLYYSDKGTYFEVYESMSKDLDEILKDRNIQYVLLGNHDEKNNDVNNPLLKKILDKIISSWPRKMIVNGRDLGGKLENKEIKFAKVKRKEQMKMKKLLTKAGVLEGNLSKNKYLVKDIKEDAILAIPDYKDRTLLTKSIIFKNPLLYNSSLTNKRLFKDNNVKTLVYLDVSGSVVDNINEFASLLLKPYKNKECRLFAFSTIAVPVSYKDFRLGKYQTTGGTSIDCIFDHYFSLEKKKQTKKILILTDGEVGSINNDYLYRIKKEKIEIYCGLFGNYTKSDLQDISQYMEVFN